jgi:chitinase
MSRTATASLMALAAILSILAGPAAATGKTGQVTVFWGRNKDEGSLREACDTGLYTMVIMSFLNVYGHGKYNLDLSGHALAGIGDDIKHCQSVGVPVSLSIGGFGTGYSLRSRQAALDLFDHLWNAYFGGSKPGVRRPFGDAWLDGVDLFLEHGTPADRYDVLARELAKHNIRGGPGKPLHLTATPRCGFPPAGYLKRAVDTGIFERVHVRIYDDGDGDCEAYWQQRWDEWTKAYPATRFYVGMTASEMTHGWIHPKNVYYDTAPFSQKAPNYGGFMIWDRYYDEQTNYTSMVKYYA